MDMIVRQRIVHTVKMSAIVFGAVLLLGGCGKKAENTNLLAGMELVEQYEFQGAIESFEAALLNNEDAELTYRGQGIAYMGLGNYAEAENAFLRSIENAQGSPTALVYDTNYYLASAYMKQGKYADAEKIYSAIIGLKKKKRMRIICGRVRSCGRIVMMRQSWILRERSPLTLTISSWSQMPMWRCRQLVLASREKHI